ncbi:MAG: hypothetical protein M1840_005754 [Geoglossum simile]|nr:MAG: hypothetical protein M1840_005754 [Geoglossum simile]
MDQDMIPILEREDDYDFYSPIWQYSDCHPKAPPPSPAPSSDQRLSMVNLMASSPVWEILPLLLPQRLSTASSATVPSMVCDRHGSSLDEDYGGFECMEKCDQYSMTARLPDAFEWMAIDHDVDTPPRHAALVAEPPYNLQPDNDRSGPGEQQVYVDSNCYGIATTTPEKSPIPRFPPPTYASPPQRRSRDCGTPAPRPLGVTFPTLPCVPPNTNATAAIGPRRCEPFPVPQLEQSVFEDDEDNTKGGRFGSLSSHIHLPSLRHSGERGKTLKRRASSILHGVLTCGLVRET